MFARSFVFAFAVIGAPVAAQASSNAPAPAAAPSIPRATFIASMDAGFAKMDANRDGRITKSEIEAFQHNSSVQQIQARNHAVFTALDTDHNGQLSPAEFAKFTATPPQPNAAPMLEHFDANHDSAVSLVEYRAATLANFDKLDTDKDGIVTAAEMKAGGIVKK